MSRHWILMLLVGLTFGELNAADRYFYYSGEKAYYCKAPAAYVQGCNCYVVRDDSNLQSVNGFPVISTALAAKYMKDAVEPVSSVSCCGTPQLRCLPRVTSRCRCDESCKPTPIDRPDYEGLETDSDVVYFYEKLGTIRGTIPTPYISMTKNETFRFRERTLNYKCEKEGDENCSGTCTIQTCEVFQKDEDCEKTCEMRDKEGTLLIGIRTRRTPTDPIIVDVFIGKAGKADFPMYPTNVVVLQGGSIGDLKAALQVPNFDINNDVTPIPGVDLIGQL